jgi:hypothetical protein
MVKCDTSLFKHVFTTVAMPIIEIVTLNVKFSTIIAIIFLMVASVLATIVTGVTSKHQLFLPHLCILFFYSGH